MSRYVLLFTLTLVAATGLSATRTYADISVVCDPQAPPQVRLAAKEVLRYVYQCSGTLLPMRAVSGSASDIVVAEKGNPLLRDLAAMKPWTNSLRRRTG